MVDEGMERHIIQCTNENLKTIDSELNLLEDELDAFIGLMYMGGLSNQRNFPLHLLWSEELGVKIFRDTMSRNRFNEIKKSSQFAVFCNILDLSMINAWIILKKVTGSNMSRRTFMLEVIQDLTKRE